FFQAEDGIRDDLVTGVQTCALPILPARREEPPQAEKHPGVVVDHEHARHRRPPAMLAGSIGDRQPRAESPVNGRLPASPASVDGASAPWLPDQYQRISRRNPSPLRSTRFNRRTAMEARALRVGPSRPASKRGPQPRFVGGSAAMQRLLRVVARVGPKDITILVGGETGTGKELVASLVHAQSIRSSAPLVMFNCAAIPGELAAAELLG